MKSSFSLLAATAVLFISSTTAAAEKNSGTLKSNYFHFSLTLTSHSSDILLHGKTAFLLKFIHSPLNLFNEKPSNETITITYSVETQNAGNSTWTSSGVLVSHLTAAGWPFQAQPAAGVPYIPEEMVTFAFNSTSPLTTVFRVTVHKKGNTTQQTSRAVLAPFQASETAGYRNVTLLDEHFNAVGEVRGQ